MPTYQYRCTHCEHELEVVQKFSDSALTVCPSCNGDLRKIYNAVGVVFKGSGFYKTDSRKASGTGESSSSSSDNGAGSGATKSSSGSDSSKGGAAANGSASTASGTSSTSKPAASTSA